MHFTLFKIDNRHAPPSALMGAFLIGSCGNKPKNHSKVMSKGEFISIASPLGGRFAAAAKDKGARVRSGKLRVRSIRHGDSLQVTVDGVRDPWVRRVSYIWLHAAYTPPVISHRKEWL
jgi:hypothetical protein